MIASYQNLTQNVQIVNYNMRPIYQWVPQPLGVITDLVCYTIRSAERR